MDVFILGGLVLVLTVVVYILATLGTKETPFEEALAEQRQKREQENAPVKSEKVNKFKPKPRKQKPKRDSDSEATGKPGGSPVAGSDPEQESEPEPKREPTPTPTPPPPVIDVQPSPQPQQDKKKDKKKKKEEKPSKDAEAEATSRMPQVVEKVEEAMVTKVEATKSEAKKPEKKQPEAAPEPTLTPPPPQVKEPKKDVKEPKKDVKEPKKEIKEPKKEVEAPVKRPQIEIIETVENQIVQSLPPVATGKVTPTQEKNKKKKDKATAQNETKLISMVQRSMLNGNDIQTLIDILLNKQQQNNDGGEWVEKGGRVDPITQLRRQLEEVEVRLKDKDEAHSALTAKITDLRAELNGERSRAIKLKTQLDDTISNYTRQQEVAATNALSTQTAKLNDLRKELEQEYKTTIEQQQLALDQLKGNTHDGEVSTLRASLNDAEVQSAVLLKQQDEMRCAYDEHIRKLEEKLSTEEANKNAQLAELQTQLANSDAARAQALSEAAAMGAERDTLTAQLNSENTKYAQVQHKLQDSLREKTEVDSRLHQVESELSSVHQVVLDQTNQIERLKEEKESLASQSVRPAAEGQENGDVHAEQSVAPDTTHLESLVKEKDGVIEKHVSEVNNLSKEITRLREDLEQQRAKNNDVSSIMGKERAKVRAVLRRISPTVAIDDALEHDAFLNEFEAKALQVSTQTLQSKPEVVEKVVEIEKVVEKEVLVDNPELKTKIQELTKENSQLKTQVAEFQASIPKVDDSNRVNELEEEVKAVNEKVVHYQTVLANTESLLKSLQASVESEEVTWSKKLTEKEASVKQLSADKANLQLQIKQLEGTLDKVRQAEELDTQLKVLQEQLQKEEKEKATLQEQLQQAQEQLTKTATQGGGEDETLGELRTENDKLRSLVTVGQDESREQDQLIQQLQQELSAVKSASTNGPANEEQCQEGAGTK